MSTSCQAVRKLCKWTVISVCAHYNSDQQSLLASCLWKLGWKWKNIRFHVSANDSKKDVEQESHLRMESQRMKETERVNHVLMTNILHNLIWESFLACQRVPTKLFCKPPTALFNIASFNAPSCKYEMGTSSPHRYKLAGLASYRQDWKRWCAVCCRIRLLIHFSQCHQTTPGNEFKLYFDRNTRSMFTTGLKQ